MPQPKNPPPTPEPTPEPTPPAAPVSADEPEWARRLRESLESLPGRIQATVSEDNERSIAERVHGLFEQSGAFVKDEPKPDNPADEPDDPPKPEPDEAPQGKDSVARRWFGAH